jgi:hydrogenase maturation protein HypF
VEAQRLRIVVRGAVQGVGFRPALFRMAQELRLGGHVINSPEGVIIEAEGSGEALGNLLRRIRSEAPPLASIQGIHHSLQNPIGEASFEIRTSDASGTPTVPVLPDIATCPDCLREILDPRDRRYGHPFTNCTNCGPRFTIIRSLPYDRRNTSMAAFPMCARCRAEYENPADRRFHAQPIACPDCGPRLEGSISDAARTIRDGGIVALKGMGGYQLIVDARDEAAVRRLRDRKRRECKPLAMMAASMDVIRGLCHVSQVERRLLTSPEAPIVLLRRRDGVDVAGSVAPVNPYLGIMLPTTALHHLLLREVGGPVVATSGNLSEEPICIENEEAQRRLGDIADLFLLHDRPILRPVDDSVVSATGVIRRARGYAPLPVMVREDLPPILAVGGQMKNTVAVSVGRQVILSQHIGDLSTEPALEAFLRAQDDLTGLYGVDPVAIACDSHPDYASTREAERSGLDLIRVQHHHAHVLACMAENDLGGTVLGVCWDGTGHGPDGTVWGGEFLRASPDGFERVGHLRKFRLPGGEQAILEPRRSAMAVLFEAMGTVPSGDAVLAQMIRRGIQSPWTSSAGRLFDAVASLLDLRHSVSFEAQAAMDLEFAAMGSHAEGTYPFDIRDDPMILDWAPMIRQILDEREAGVPAGDIAARFHHTLAEGILAMALRIEEADVVITGGCFQNRFLTERTVLRLEGEGFRVWRHHRIPPNDGGIALGQVLAAAARGR